MASIPSRGIEPEKGSISDDLRRRAERMRDVAAEREQERRERFNRELAQQEREERDRYLGERRDDPPDDEEEVPW